MDSVHEHKSTSLNPGAEYGNLPFDQFVLVSVFTLCMSGMLMRRAKTNWNIDIAEENDQEQWNVLASRWLSMSHVDRSVGAQFTTN